MSACAAIDIMYFRPQVLLSGVNIYVVSARCLMDPCRLVCLDRPCGACVVNAAVTILPTSCA